MAVADKLNELVTQRNNLADNLNTMGVDASTDETLSTLVPKVLEISTGSGGGDISEYIDTSTTLTGNTSANSCGYWVNFIKKIPTRGLTFGTNAGYSFYKYPYNELDTTGWDTSATTNMTNMFDSISVSQLDLSNLNTSNVTNMTRMFNAIKIDELNLDVLDTSNVNNMSYMFNSAKIKSLMVDNINTNNVTNMTGMFNYYNYSTTANTEDEWLDINFSSDNVTNMSNMFYCANCTPIFHNFNTSNVTNMSNMFTEQMMSSYYHKFSLDISSFNAEKVTNVNTMFRYNMKLEELSFMENLGKGYTQKTANYSNYKLDLSSATNLTYDSLMNVINNLYDLNLTYDVANGGTLYTQSLVLGSTNLAKLTSEEIQTVTNKGWVVS